jgi:hypothetical protein
MPPAGEYIDQVKERKDKQHQFLANRVGNHQT